MTKYQSQYGAGGTQYSYYYEEDDSTFQVWLLLLSYYFSFFYCSSCFSYCSLLLFSPPTPSCSSYSCFYYSTPS